ncbi:MAG: hypothetical protein ACTHJM_03565 [Marmoricola sp.]
MGKHRDESGSTRANGPGPTQERPPVGSLAEEATQLFAVLSGIARDQASQYTAGAESMTSSAASALRNVNEHIATGDAECTYCPICRVVHAARTASPEVKAHLSSALLSLAQAASSFMAPPSAPQSKDEEQSAGDDYAAPADGALHKIDLDDGAWD